MEAMPRPRWPHLLREVSRHGTVRWVVRVGHGPRMPITAAYGSPEFEAQYLLRSAERPPLARVRPALARSNGYGIAIGTRRRGRFCRTRPGTSERASCRAC
jgi:hypothetical protein